MAENKKSIIVYADWLELFEYLTNEEAGLLIKHFFRYVNDLNPIAPDRFIEAQFIPIKQTLKRDLDKWEQTLEGRSKAGKASAEAKRLAKLAEQSSTNSTSVDFEQQSSTNSTDSVNDSVSVNESDNVILLEKETKEDFSEIEILPLKDQEEKRKKVAPKKEINLPSEFIEIWDLWLEYRTAKKIKGYANDKFEQMAIDKLLKFSNSNPIIAKQIINESITNSWTGFFELKNKAKDGTESRPNRNR